MTHRELVKAMASDLGSERAARAAIRAFVRAASYGLVRDGVAKVHELGIFRLRIIPARRIKRADGVEVDVEKTPQVSFKAAEKMKRALKGVVR